MSPDDQTIHVAGLCAYREEVLEDARLRLLCVAEYIGLPATPSRGGEPVRADGPGGGPGYGT
jgi:hypothetical protein